MKKFALLGLISVAVMAMAQAPKPTASIKLAKTTASKNKEFKGDVTVVIPKGFHAYQNPPAKDYEIPLKITSADGSVKIVKAAYPKGKSGNAGGSETMVYEGTVKIPVTFKAPAKAGKTSIKVKVNYQLCDDSACFPPSTVETTATVTVK